MNRKGKKKRFNFKRFIIFLFILIILITSYILLSKKPVRSILVTGNTVVSDNEIIKLAGLEDYPSYLKFNTFKAKKNIKKNELIESVTIKKKSHYKIVINVKEYKVLFYNRTNNLYVINSNKTLNEYDNVVPTLINFVSDDILEKFIDKFSLLDSSVTSKISEIEYAPSVYDNERFIFYMNDSNLVYVTITKLKDFNNYSKIKEQIGTNSGILYLDSGNYFEIKD